MRTALNLPPRPRRARKSKLSQLHCADALRACESAATCVQRAGEELAARWMELARELTDGAAPTELLRTRAWCNVLELRLRERAAALAEARQLLDGAWPQLLHASPAAPAVSCDDPNIPCEPTEAHWPFLAHATKGFAAVARLNRTAK